MRTFFLRMLALIYLLAPYAAHAQNLIQNGGFNSGLSGWQQEGSGITATWDSGDSAGSQNSGSMKLETSVTRPPGVMRQSFPVTPGYSYEFRTNRRGTPSAGSIEFSLREQPPASVTYGVPNNVWGTDSDILTALPGMTTGSVALGLKFASGTALAFFDSVSVVQLPTAIQRFAAEPAAIPQGQCTRLFVEASSASSVNIDQGVGSLPAPSFNSQWFTSNLCPAATTTYTLTVAGPTGTVTRQATITVVPPPGATFTATPPSISEGDAATLSWTTTNATSISIDNGIGSVAATGTMSVAPSTTTTYTLTAVGIGGSTTKQVSVTVTPPKPQISFTASPRTIAEGERSTLSWNVLNATAVSIDHGVGNRPASGSISVSPAATTTYRLTASGPGGSSSAQVTVTVLAAPVITFSAAPSAISRGAASTLAWTVTDATLVIIDHGIGAQSPSGAIEVRPSETTTYLLTATGPGGVRLAQTTVTVVVTGRRRAVRH